jgi:hypothetical protein
VQNRYVGDIGDYVKFAILRALSPGYRLGIAWWLYPDETHNRDGRHVDYLDKPEQWRQFDPALFDTLCRVVRSATREVQALEQANILPGTVFANELIPVHVPANRRGEARREWFLSVQQALKETDLVFVDPDNGLEPAGHRPGSAASGESVMVSELLELAKPGRCIIVYRYQTRRKGGHEAEIKDWADRLRESGFATVDAVRARPYSPRAFFLLNAPHDFRVRAERLEEAWGGKITWADHGRVLGQSFCTLHNARQQSRHGVGFV